MWEKAIRCTVCTWRGPMDVAESAARIKTVAADAKHAGPLPASPLDDATEEIQHAYDVREKEAEAVGAHHLPPCPQCGHHTLPVKLHAYNAVG